MATYGLKVSKPGFDVKTANSADLYVDTSLPLLKVHMQGTGQQVSDGTDLEIRTDITHSLGYNPQADVYMECSPGTSRCQIQSTYLNVGSTTPTVEYPDTNTLRIRGNVFDGFAAIPAGTYKYYYRIYKDPIV